MGYSRTVEKNEEDESFRCVLEMKLRCSQHFNCMQCWHPASVLMCAFGNRSILWETGLFSERGREERSLTLFSWQSSHWDISCVTDLLLPAALMFSVYRLEVSLEDQTIMITIEFQLKILPLMHLDGIFPALCKHCLQREMSQWGLSRNSWLDYWFSCLQRAMASVGRRTTRRLMVT